MNDINFFSAPVNDTVFSANATLDTHILDGEEHRAYLLSVYQVSSYTPISVPKSTMRHPSRLRDAQKGYEVPKHGAPRYHLY